MENTPNGAPAPIDHLSHGNSDYLTIAAFLEKSHTALSNARLPDIAPLMENRGIANSEVMEKLAEVENLRALNEKQKAEYGEQYDATEDYKKAKRAAHEDYMDYLQLARIAFQGNPSATTALGLGGKRAQSQSGYVSQGLLFYNNAMASDTHKVALKKKGISDDDLRAGQQAFRNLQMLTAAQQKETGEAQQATNARDKAYDTLHEWMSDFYKTAKVARRKNPQMMEQLGIKEK
ncbi:MAG: hypothetical protein ABI378_06075 [Chitinophagaceae bacterium]